MKFIPPDSSRFWFANEYEQRFAKGEEQKKIDKEYVREWLRRPWISR